MLNPLGLGQVDQAATEVHLPLWIDRFVFRIEDLNYKTKSDLL